MRLPEAVLSVLVVTVLVTTTAVHSFAIPPTATTPATHRPRAPRQMATAGRPEALEARNIPLVHAIYLVIPIHTVPHGSTRTVSCAVPTSVPDSTWYTIRTYPYRV